MKHSTEAQIKQAFAKLNLVVDMERECHEAIKAVVDKYSPRLTEMGVQFIDGTTEPDSPIRLLDTNHKNSCIGVHSRDICETKTGNNIHNPQEVIQIMMKDGPEAITMAEVHLMGFRLHIDQHMSTAMNMHQMMEEGPEAFEHAVNSMAELIKQMPKPKFDGKFEA